MATGFGHASWIGFAPETTYGTYVAPTKFLELISENVKGEHSMLSRPSLRFAGPQHVVQSKKSVSGGFEFDVSYAGPEFLFKNALGTNTTTGAGPYTHTMTTAAALPTGISLHINRDSASVGGSSAFKYEGCQITKLTLTQKMEENLRCRVEVLGEDWDNIAVATPTFPTFTRADYTHFSCTIAGAAVNVVEAEWTIENVLAAERYKLGSRLRRGLGRGGQRKITGSLTFEFEQLTEYNFYKNLSANEIILTWSSSPNSITITNPISYITGSDPEITDAAPIHWKCGFETFINTTETDQCSFVVVNNVSTIP